MSVNVTSARAGLAGLDAETGGARDLDGCGASLLDEARALRDADQGVALSVELRALARRDPDAFREALDASVGEKLDADALEQLLTDIGSGDLEAPAVRFVDAETLGGSAYGAYSAEEGGVIYLDRRLQGDPSRLERVYAEEFGHHVDALLGGSDTRGDEGALFSRTLYEGPLDERARAALEGEDDSGLIVIDGRQILVEFFGEGGQVGHPGGGSAPATPPPSPPPPSPPPPSPPPSTIGGGGPRSAERGQEAGFGTGDGDGGTPRTGDRGAANGSGVGGGDGGDGEGLGGDGLTPSQREAIDAVTETPASELERENAENGLGTDGSPFGEGLGGDEDEDEPDSGAGSADVGVLGGGGLYVAARTFGLAAAGTVGSLLSLLTLSGSSTAPPRDPESTTEPATPGAGGTPPTPDTTGDDLTPEELAMAFGETEADREPLPVAGDPIAPVGTPPLPAEPLGPVTTPPFEADPLAGTGIPGFDPAPAPGEEFPDGIPGIASPLPVDDPLRSDTGEDDVPVPETPGEGGEAVGTGLPPLPADPDSLLEQGYVEVSDPRAAENGHRTFEKDGDTIRFDEGEEGQPGFAGRDHYHRDNPDATGKRDQYLDKNGNPVAKGSVASHLLPGD